MLVFHNVGLRSCSNTQIHCIEALNVTPPEQQSASCRAVLTSCLTVCSACTSMRVTQLTMVFWQAGGPCSITNTALMLHSCWNNEPCLLSAARGLPCAAHPYLKAWPSHLPLCSSLRPGGCNKPQAADCQHPGLAANCVHWQCRSLRFMCLRALKLKSRP